MRQVLQELGTGRTLLAEVPEPGAPRGGLRIVTRRSLISAGTERMLVEFGRAGWIERARQQPERVRQVMGKIQTDGLLATVDAVRSKLDQSIPLGYCNVGIVDEARDAPGFAVGDRVVSNGSHAEVVAVPVNLCARVPEGVSDDAAAFAVLGAIALQGIRLAAPTLGETFVVTGLGLVGLVTVQLLRANGCRVLGIDPDARKCELARGFGAQTVDLGRGEDPLAVADALSQGRGVDGVLITASTDSDAPVSQGARMCRKRGRIVLVGVAGLKLNRAEFYDKELSFQVSCSYGPGRYDPEYELRGHDYPFGLVRWTEQRNFEAILELMAAGKLDVLPLITHRFALENAEKAYDLLATGAEPYLGILLDYPQRAIGQPAVRVVRMSAAPVGATPAAASEPVVGFIGAGNYASRILVPAFARTGARLAAVASNGGVSAAHLARKHGIAEVSTDADALIANPAVNTLVIATRHDTHASFVVKALAAGKHVFVEKPLGITPADLDAIETAWAALPAQSRPVLLVGFNRRFAPHIVRMKSLLDSQSGPKSLIVTVNAGAVPAAHWTRSTKEGGGRLVGEGCHFIDLMRFLVGAPISRCQVSSLGTAASGGPQEDKATVTLTFQDGSVGTLHYLANGHASFPKERVEVFCGGRILQMDNFRRLRGYGWSSRAQMKSWRQDKGQSTCVGAFIDAIKTGRGAPIPFSELIEVSRFSVAAAESVGHSVP